MSGTASPFALGRLDDLAVGLKPSLLMGRLRDERGEPFVPEGWQAEYLDCLDPAVLLLAYRQSGKTTATSIKALHVGLFEPGRLSLILSPTDRQSGIVLDRIKRFYSQLGGSLGEAATATQHRVRFDNGSEIVSLPGNNPDQVRGFANVRLLIVDEAARTTDQLYAAVLPMVADDGQIVGATTPAGRRGWFFREWSGAEDWHRIRVAPGDSGRISEAKLRARRARMTPQEFATEYMLSFGSTDDALYPEELIQAAACGSVVPLEPDWVPWS